MTLDDLPLNAPRFNAERLEAHPLSTPLPHLQKTGSVTQLIVEGKPFVMLAGELHNSSASSVEYMAPLFDRLATLNLNTVIGTVSWELLEPEENRFDFTLVDAQIQEAQARNLRLVLIWFATWKNATSTYVPEWVKTDPKRFPQMKTRPRTDGRVTFGTGMVSLSPLSANSLAADAKAFAALMRHLREVDGQHTVIMVQVENEAGLLGDSRDRSPLAEAAWSEPVPPELMTYFAENRATLLPKTLQVWGANGFRSSGTWAEVFGNDAFADEVFMAWHVGRYIGAVAAAGKAELDLPMYANAWLGPQPGQAEPGEYPSGGPVARMLDIWRAATPSLDLLAPDIYVDDFQGVCEEYARSGNPLFIPEVRAIVGNLFWALGQHAALGFSPFGIEDLPQDHQIGQAYAVLRELIPLLTHYQAQGKVRGILVEPGVEQTILLGGYRITARPYRPLPWEMAAGQQPLEIPPGEAQGKAEHKAASPFGPQPPDTRPRGLVIATAPDEFLVAGSGMDLQFAPESGSGKVGFLSIDEGRYVGGDWVPGRRLNGDELRVALLQSRVGLLKVRLYRYEG